MPNERPAPPWFSFLSDLDAQFGEDIDVHCMGRTYCVYLERVRLASYPDNYESRLIRVFSFWRRLKLWALEAHDLALTKLERSNDRDLRDVMYLARSGFCTAKHSSSATEVKCGRT